MELILEEKQQKYTFGAHADIYMDKKSDEIQIAYNVKQWDRTTYIKYI